MSKWYVVMVVIVFFVMGWLGYTIYDEDKSIKQERLAFCNENGFDNYRIELIGFGTNNVFCYSIEDNLLIQKRFERLKGEFYFVEEDGGRLNENPTRFK